MTVLARLLNGDGPRVLQTCRFEGLGGDLYGREAIQDQLFALGPLLMASLLDVETARMGVWMDANRALVGELIDGQVQRLWLLSDQVSLSPPLSIDIPSDPDLAQATSLVRFDPRDHTELNPDDADRILDAVEVWPGSDLARFRPVVLRAASIGPDAIALLRLEGETIGGSGAPVACNGLVVVHADSQEHRLDSAGMAQARLCRWTPRL